MKRDDFPLAFRFADKLTIDNFARRGGTSTGLEAAFDLPIDIAIGNVAAVQAEAFAMENFEQELQITKTVAA